MTGTVRYELDGHVATITYDRPHVLNAIDAEMRADLNAGFARFRDDEEAWVGIVTGEGRAFCVGADLSGAGAAGEFPGTFWEKPTMNSFESGWEIFKPVIAAVNGYCLGYGLTLVTWCDFVIASERAQLGFPEVTIGVPTIVGAIRHGPRVRAARRPGGAGSPGSASRRGASARGRLLQQRPQSPQGVERAALHRPEG